MKAHDLGRTRDRRRTSRFCFVLTTIALAAALSAGFASGNTRTGALVPGANGTYIDWFGDVRDVSETSNFNCGGNDSIGKGGADPDRESFTVDIAAIPVGATITSVAVTVRDAAAAADVDGTYQTFVRLNTTDTDSGVNLAAKAQLFDACNEPQTQTIDVPDAVRSESTTLEIGVVKTPPDGSAIRVGTITAEVTYNQTPTTPELSSPTTGSTTTDSAPTFDWTDATDPDPSDTVSYDVQADDDCAFLSPELDERGLVESTLTPSSPLALGTYCWRVRAVDDDNLASGWSNSWSVTIAARPTLLVIVDVVNDDGGTLAPGDFTLSVTGGNPLPASFAGQASPGQAVTLNPGSYGIGIPPRGYVITFSAGCSGSIAAGETKTCTVTANDLPVQQLLSTLVGEVFESTSLSPALKSQLTARVAALLANFDPANAQQRQTMCTALSVFRTLVRVLSGRGIAPTLANKWIADANRIRTILAC
jgi:hypothetical protein